GRQRVTLVVVPSAMDADVHHRQRARAPVLHRAVLAARLRALYARRRDAADAARDLERTGIPFVSVGTPFGGARQGLRQFRPALEPVRTDATGPGSRVPADPGQPIVSAIIPCLDEEAAIGALVGAVLAQGVAEVVVVDGGSCDRTVERAMAAGATVVIERIRGYGRAMQAGINASRRDAGILLFLDGDGSDDPAFIPAMTAPIVAGEAAFVHGSRLCGGHEPGSLSLQQLVAGRLAGALLGFVYGARFTDMSPFRAIRRDVLGHLGMREPTYGWNLEMLMRVA